MQKVYGGEKPVPIWLDDNEENGGGSSIKRILFSLNIRVKVYNDSNVIPNEIEIKTKNSLPSA